LNITAESSVIRNRRAPALAGLYPVAWREAPSARRPAKAGALRILRHFQWGAIFGGARLFSAARLFDRAFGWAKPSKP